MLNYDPTRWPRPPLIYTLFSCRNHAVFPFSLPSTFYYPLHSPCPFDLPLSHLDLTVLSPHLDLTIAPSSHLDLSVCLLCLTLTLLLTSPLTLTFLSVCSVSP